MRIICTVTNDLSQDQRMDRICTSLARAGHQVTLVGRELPDSLPLPDRPYKTHRIRCKNLSGKKFYTEYNFKLIRSLLLWRYDAICSVDLDTLSAGIALTRGRAKLVFDAHEWFSETPEVVGRPMIKGVWRGMAKALVPRTDARYTVAPQLAKKLEQEYGMPFQTVRNLPLRSTKADNRITPDKKILLYQGMLNPGRGLETAIEALAKLPSCELWLVGSGPEEGALRRCSEKFGVSDRVRFAGFRPPAELANITGQAWLGLNLLDGSSPSYYYSLANKALDYIQAGLPSIQMDFPEYRTLQRQYGCFLLQKDLKAKSLAQNIQSLIERPVSYEELEVRCSVAAEELVWEREEEKLLRIWREVAR
ncbi:glycosyltransferase family 4 protein [Neolewinella agarilytica]|uniref:Glycosyltransferase involved in cell wall bisynthesis n=1 Tax=Neolewinella agarilytica TaxID=478744 RepID=A0A1H8ZP39_9BACT|nr:glycosyltransferase family 4 protein [Neolewinella agarilytica]SEP66114.1 Glycosyltransferase involved in cell wall bisynthesis [Neolewinella agarilytica]